MSLNQEPRMSEQDAFEAAIVALKAQGLAPTKFGLSIRDRMARGEINADEATRLITEHYKAHIRTPIGA